MLGHILEVEVLHDQEHDGETHTAPAKYRYCRYVDSVVMAHPSRKKADMNCARASGLLLDFFLSPGLQAPVNQNLRVEFCHIVVIMSHVPCPML